MPRRVRNTKAKGIRFENEIGAFHEGFGWSWEHTRASLGGADLILHRSSPVTWEQFNQREVNIIGIQAKRGRRRLSGKELADTKKRLEAWIQTWPGRAGAEIWERLDGSRICYVTRYPDPVLGARAGWVEKEIDMWGADGPPRRRGKGAR